MVAVRRGFRHYGPRFVGPQRQRNPAFFRWRACLVSERRATLFYNPFSLYSEAYHSWVSAPLATTLTDNVSISMWVDCGGCSGSRDDFVVFYNGEFPLGRLWVLCAR
jgi:hypothetical protein